MTIFILGVRVCGCAARALISRIRKGNHLGVPLRGPSHPMFCFPGHSSIGNSDEEELDEETEKEIKDIERIGKEIERVLLRIGSSQEPLAVSQTKTSWL